MERVVGSAAWMTGASVVSSVGGLIFWAVVARVLGPQGLGEVAAAVSLANVASAILNLGFQQYVLRFLPTEGPPAFWAGLLASSGAGAAAAGALAALGHPWSGLLAFLSLASSAAFGGLIAVGRARLYFASIATGAALKIALAALKLSPLPVLALSSALSFAAALAGVAPALGWSRPSGWGDLLAAATANYPLNFSASFGVSLGVLLVRSVAGPEPAGVFYLLSMAVMAVGSVSTALSASSIPVMAVGGTGLAERGARIAVGVNLPLVVAAAGASRLLLSLLGPGYQPYSLPLAFALPAAVGFAATSLASAVYNVEKRWLRLGGLGLLSTASFTASSLAVPHLGVGLALLLGSIPPAVVGARDVSPMPFAVGLAAAAVFSPLAALWPPASPLAVAASLAILHATGVFRLREYLEVARLVARAL
ncbi:MAG: lipopolysaccharide biosynthesis protein [Thermoproteus sp.]